MERVVPESVRPLPRPIVDGAKEVDAGDVPAVDDEIHLPRVLVVERSGIVARVAEGDDGNDVAQTALRDEPLHSALELLEDGFLLWLRRGALEAFVAE